MKVIIQKRYLAIIKTFGPAGGRRYRFFSAENDEQAKEEAFRIKEEIGRKEEREEEEIRRRSDPDYTIDKVKIDRIYQVREVEF